MRSEIVDGASAYDHLNPVAEAGAIVAWPFVIGGVDVLELLQENQEVDDRSVEQIIAASQNLHGPDVLSTLKQQHLEDAYDDRPPTSRDQALELAMEQYAYCYDIVEQGTETITNLAALLMNGRNWYFWWD